VCGVLLSFPLWDSAADAVSLEPVIAHTPKLATISLGY
jgi:hypothetical protein